MTPEVRFGMFRLGRGGLEVCRWLELVGPGRGLELRRAGLDVSVHISVVGASGISGSTTHPILRRAPRTRSARLGSAPNRGLEFHKGSPLRIA